VSEFKVQVQNLYGAMDSMEALETILQQAADGVCSVKRNLRAQVRQRERIDSRLNSTADQLKAQRQSVGRAVSVGRQAAGLYEKTEAQLLNIKAGATAEANPEIEEPPFSFDKLFNWDNLWKLVGSVGPAGQFSKTIASFANGKFWDGAKDIVKLVGAGAKAVDGDAGVSWWKKLLGWKAPSASKPVNNPLDASFSKEIGKYKVSAKQSAGQNIAGIAKWVGVFATVAEKGVSNWDEFKDDGGLSNPRLYAETVTESAIKIGSDIAISTAVGAAAVVVLGTNPVGWAAVGVGVAVAATTVAVNWALDGISQLITGNKKGWVENVSDGIIDRWESVGNKVKEAKDSVVKWWNGLFR